ncbi:MAG: arylesterase [Bdellovibrionales bacterium]|nr:arylesterase [Bdellovibrionales bacterium]
MFRWICLLSLCLFFNVSLGSQDKKIYILGDSLTEGYGVASDKAFPAKLQKIINQKYPQKYRVIGAGISGSTTASGLKRLQWIIKSKPFLVVLALGANDGLRGFPVASTKENLGTMIEFLKNQSIHILLAGMKVPPNYGKEYSQQFDSMWRELQHKYKVKLMPFLLKDVAGEKDMNQEDGIHPNEKGHEKIADNLFNEMMEFL